MSKEMTTKEDIKKALDGLAQFIIMNDTGTDESASAIEWHNTLTEALTRAKKEHELLGLYKERSTFVFMPDCNYKDMSIKSLDFKIKQLEEELK